jgi:hypothetical protein
VSSNATSPRLLWRYSLNGRRNVKRIVVPAAAAKLIALLNRYSATERTE